MSDEAPRCSNRRKRKLHYRKPKSVMVHSLDHDNVEWEPGDPLVPGLRLRGMWLHEVQMYVGTHVSVEVSEHGILLRAAEPVEPKVRKMGKRQLARLKQADGAG